MAARLTLEEVLERLEGDDCGLSSEWDSDSEDGIYGYMAEADTAVSLAAMSSERVLDSGEDDLDSDSDAASPVVPTVLLEDMEGQCTHNMVIPQ